MPRRRLEDEIEEILETADPDDKISTRTGRDPDENLVTWEDVPRRVPSRRKRGARQRRDGPPLFTSSRLIVAAVIVLVVAIATKFMLMWMLGLVAILGVAAYYVRQQEKSGRRGPTRYWRDSPIDYGDDEDPPPPGWRGG
jgi:hypothetical protein